MGLANMASVAFNDFQNKQLSQKYLQVGFFSLKQNSGTRTFFCLRPLIRTDRYWIHKYTLNASKCIFSFTIRSSKINPFAFFSEVIFLTKHEEESRNLFVVSVLQQSSFAFLRISIKSYNSKGRIVDKWHQSLKEEEVKEFVTTVIRPQ
jgi:hypothetical protein